jgi:hypothetical protein
MRAWAGIIGDALQSSQASARLIETSPFAARLTGFSQVDMIRFYMLAML